MDQLTLLSLYRLTQAARDMGHYNLAKLLEAARASLVAQTIRASQLPLTNQDLVSELGALTSALAHTPLAPPLLTAIRQAGAAIAERGMVLLADAPAVFVCRHCGHAALGQMLDRCPACGAGALTFETIRAAHYLEPEAPEPVLDHLRAMPDLLDQLVAGLTDEQAARKVPGAEGEWSLLEAAGHLRDANQLLARRVDLLLTQVEPELKAQATWNEAASAAAQTVAAVAAQFRRERHAIAERLAALSSEQWARAGQHSEFGRMTVLGQATYFAKHEHWHLAQMTRLRTALLTAPPA